MDHRATFVDARLRGHDGEPAILVIPAKAGIQTNYPNLLRRADEALKAVT